VTTPQRRGAWPMPLTERPWALGLGDMSTGRPGRVAGIYEKSVTGLPYILAYAVTQAGGEEVVAIVRVIHTSRDWTAERWPD